MAPSFRRFALASGALAPVVAFGAVLVATLLSPAFAWPTSALSELGVTPASASLFNGGLVVGGVLGVPFVRVLTTDRGPLVAGVFALSVAAMAGVGVFPSGHPLHFPVALAFYLLLTATLLVDGLVALRTGAERWAVTTLALASVHLGSWTLWVIDVGVGPGLAVPEAVGAALFSVWVWASAWRLR